MHDFRCTQCAVRLAGVLPRSPQLGLCTMQVLVGDAGADRQEEQHGQVAAQHGAEQLQQGEHVFLYKLVPGAVASSYGVRGRRAQASEAGQGRTHLS